jgi:PAS domain S-box-containing protein
MEYADPRTDEMRTTDRVLLLVQGSRNRALLSEALAEYEVLSDDAASDGAIPEFDLCLADESSIPRVAAQLAERKEASEHVYLPVLLLVDERAHRRGFQELTHVVDDTLLIPAAESVIQSRVESLLRTRRESRKLETQRDQLELYRHAMDDATTGICITDADGDQPLTYVNDAFEEITGYQESEVLGRNCRFLQGENTSDAAVQQLHDAITDGESVQVVLRNYRKDGTEFWNQVEISPVYDADDELTQFVGFQSDVTERHDLQDQLSEERETLERLFEASPVGITVLDTSGQIVRANGTAEDVLGLKQSDVIGRAFDAPEWEIVGEDGAPVDSASLPFSQVMETGEPVRNFEHGIKRRDEVRWLSINAAPLKDESGSVVQVISTIEDITEQRDRARERAQLIDLLDQTQQIADVGGWEIDVTAGHAEFTEALATMLEVDPRTEFTLDEALAFYHPADEPDVRAALQRLVETGDPQSIECRVETAAGETRWVNVRGVATDDAGVYRGTFQDITERREREAELRETKETLQSVIDNAPIGIIGIDTDGDVILWNPACEQLFGWRREEVVGEELPIVPPSKAEEHQRIRESVISSAEQISNFETVRRTKGGELVEVSITTAPLSDGTGDIIGVVGLMEDITERKLREVELERYERIVETTSDPIYTLNESFGFTLVNSATAAIAGEDRDAILGTHVSSVFGSSHAEALADATTRLLANDTTASVIKTSINTESGGTRRFQTMISLKHPGPDFEGVVCVGHDISDLQERERRLTVLDRVLRHNLRNKMNIVQARSSMLLAEATEPAVREHAESINDAAEALLALAETARTFHSTIDPRSTDRLQVQDVTEAIHDVAVECRVSYPAATISVECPEEAWAKTHETFELAIVELVDNAIKHGGAETTVAIRVTEDPEADEVVIEVADDGPGIPTLERLSILAGEESPLQHTNGLGLWFVRWMATNSQGSLSITDNDPTGAIIEIRLPRSTENVR